MIINQIFRPVSRSLLPHQHVYSLPSNKFISRKLSSRRHHFSQLTICHDAPVNALTSDDILIGTILALCLALLASFLQSQRSSPDFVHWNKENDDGTMNSTKVFGTDAWKEMSRPENYVFYKRKLSAKKTVNGEQKWVFIALLALFIPIFSVEFFFALSRQIICGDGPISQSELSRYLCLPAEMNP